MTDDEDNVVSKRGRKAQDEGMKSEELSRR